MLSPWRAPRPVLSPPPAVLEPRAEARRGGEEMGVCGGIFPRRGVRRLGSALRLQGFRRLKYFTMRRGLSVLSFVSNVPVVASSCSFVCWASVVKYG